MAAIIKKNGEFISNPLQRFWNKFQSLNKFLKITAIVVAVCVLVIPFLSTNFRSFASSTDSANVEAETGTLAGNASAISDASASASQSVQFGVQPVGVPGSWNIAFNDEFKTNALNTATWNPGWFGTGTGITGPISTTETACYDSSLATVPGDDTLHLQLINQQSTCRGTVHPYTGSMISSNPNDNVSGHTGYQFTYGYVEYKAYIPAASTGIAANWPGVWITGKNSGGTTDPWPTDGENDIAEVLNGHPCATFHYKDASGVNQQDGPTCPSGDYTGWHTFGVDWEPGVVTYYYDGKQVAQYTRGVTSAPMYLVVDQSTNSNQYTVVPATVQVDYVRVWQNSSPTPTDTPTVTPSPTGNCSVTLPTNTGSDTMNITLPSSGEYNLWTRLNVPTTNESVYVQVDNNCPVQVTDSTGNINNWDWVLNNSTSLSSGAHTVVVTGNEGGVKLDEVLLSQTCTPTGDGSNCLLSPTATPTPSPTAVPTPTDTPTPTLEPTSTPVPPTPTPTIDAIAPTVSITSPANGSKVPHASVLTVTANATDNVGVTSVQIYANGSLVCTAGQNSNPYSCGFSVSGKKNVSYTLSAKAHDAAGNVGTSSTVTVTTN